MAKLEPEEIVSFSCGAVVPMPTLPEESIVIPVEVAMSEPRISFSLFESE
jgi:hypothetical protein